jgi:hypothetical protein
VNADGDYARFTIDNELPRERVIPFPSEAQLRKEGCGIFNRFPPSLLSQL